MPDWLAVLLLAVLWCLLSMLNGYLEHLKEQEGGQGGEDARAGDAEGGEQLGRGLEQHAAAGTEAV